MWLINTHTYELEEVSDEKEKKYAILSHVWEEDKVTFQRMQQAATAARAKGFSRFFANTHDLTAVSHLKGFSKIQSSCARARGDLLDHLWVDTCCINKESSAELSEAINSMFQWYKSCTICYVYLFDVHARPRGDKGILEKEILSSRWFTRGWTLQELLAPRDIRFYNSQWDVLGTKKTLSSILSQRTRIDKAILDGESFSERSIAQRMSWASGRETKRPEDTAYCLLGIFGITLPIVYGEKGRAFIRLQEEIIRRSDDHSIFAWRVLPLGLPTLLAISPQAFDGCQNTMSVIIPEGQAPYSLTNRGLSIILRAWQLTLDTYLARLDCRDSAMTPEAGGSIGIFLRRMDEDDQYARVAYGRSMALVLPAGFWEGGLDFDDFPHYTPRLMKFTVPESVPTSQAHVHQKRIDGFRLSKLTVMSMTVEGTFIFDGQSFDASFPSTLDKRTGIVSISSANPNDYTFKPCANHETIPHPRFQNAWLVHMHQPAWEIPRAWEIHGFSLSFDFDFNPVLFVAMKEGLKFFPKALMQAINGQIVASPTEEWLYLQGWRTTSGDKIPNEARLCGHGELMEECVPGLWALKGDRLWGLSCRLLVCCQDGSKEVLAAISIKRVEYEKSVVWELDYRPWAEIFTRSGVKEDWGNCKTAQLT